MCNIQSGPQSKTPPTVEKNVQQKKIKDVHIAVFFDGTNNNAVQKAIFYSYKKRKEQKNVSLSEDVQKQYDEAIKLKDEINELERTILLAENSKHSYVSRNDLSYLKKKLEENKKKISTINLHPLMDTASMDIDNLYGYSNVSILYSLLNRNKQTEDTIYYDLYIEGAGATDIVEPSESNVNGLGFGLGETGVTALVSKALKDIMDFLSKKVSYLDEHTNYHFNVFGFSRGATCARLFAELATRDEGTTLEREREFWQATSRVSQLAEKNKRVPFMETGFIENLIINREYVTVDFLGIYDTVASIGFLMHRDGWTNALSMLYRPWWWNNYHGNFHYMNVHDYGLYSPHNERVKYTCHICAADEFRENFALVNLGSSIPKNATEIIIPGCHSDIGGGYVNEVGMDVVLSKFTPRKLDRFSNLVAQAAKLILPRAQMFLSNPNSISGQKAELNPNTLAMLGWVGREWAEQTKKSSPDITFDGEVATKRVVETDNDIKFKRYVTRGYSNIPLRMMLANAEEHGCDLFPSHANVKEYKIPNPLEDIGKKMLNHAKESGRVWLMPEFGYSGEVYRLLRQNYLHFTASCKIIHTRTTIKEENRTSERTGSIKVDGAENSIFEVHWENIGNNCNYDDDATICRIMYNGDPGNLKGDHKDNLHYVYELNNCQVINLKGKLITPSSHQ